MLPAPPPPPRPIVDPPPDIGPFPVDPPPPPPPPEEPPDLDLHLGGRREAVGEGRQKTVLGDGSVLMFQEHRDARTGISFKNWILTCNRCPGDCHRTRRLTRAFTARHGRMEPIAFLMAWRDMPLADGQRHSARQTQAGAKAVDDWIAAHGATFCGEHHIDLDALGAAP